MHEDDPLFAAFHRCADGRADLCLHATGMASTVTLIKPAQL